MKKGPLLVVLCYVIWGICPIYWKLLQSVDSYFILGNRIIWSALFALVLVIFRHNTAAFKLALKNRVERRRLFIAGLFCVVNWGTYIFAVNTNHILDASLAYYMFPIMAILIAAIFFREVLAPLQWIGVGFAFVGVMISILAYGHVPWLALIIGMTFAVYSAVQKNCLTGGVPALALELMYFFVPTILLLFWAIAKGQTGEVSVGQWWLLPTTGIITAVPLMLFAIGIADTDYSLSGILMYINPTLQLLVGVLVYDEKMTTPEKWTFAFVWIGLAFYLISMWLKHRQHRLKNNVFPKSD